MSLFDKYSPLNPLTPGGTNLNSMTGLNNFQKEWLNVPKKTPYLERAPLDKSAYGFLDEALRLLPPVMRREAEKAIKVGPYIAVKMITNLLIGKVTNAVSDVVYHPGKYPGGGDIQGGIVRGSLVGKIQELLDKYGISYGSYDSNDKILSRTPIHNGMRDELTPTFIAATNEYKLTKLPKSGIPDLDKYKNEIVEKDRVNSLNFIPRQKMFWVIKLSPYKDPDTKTLIPDLGVFTSKYDSRTINYKEWLPVLNYTYDRKTIETTQFQYGWGHSFSQMNAPLRGTSFSMELMDDRDHNISNYLNHIGSLAADYESASVTYWKNLCHLIEVSTYNSQWGLTARFKLIGILQNVGIVNYSSEDDTNSIKCHFSVVGEIKDNSTKEEKFK